MAKRLSYAQYGSNTCLHTIFLDGCKKGTLQDNREVDGKVYLHLGRYDRCGYLLDSAITLSFKSIPAAKRYMSEATRNERETEQ